jgi:site-specific recombinase XerC
LSKVLIIDDDARALIACKLVAVQTGLRVSEMTGLTPKDVVLGTGAHMRVIGKGRKERCTPLARPTRSVLKAELSPRTFCTFPRELSSLGAGSSRVDGRPATSEELSSASERLMIIDQ